MRIGSLFTGYGGLDMAVEAFTGGKVVWYSEIEKAACTVLDAHYPDVPNLGDIKTVDWSAVAPVDILTGGYPCQPFSAAGLRKGTNDERHLWPYVREAISNLRPELVVLENVRGHLSLGIDTVLGEMAAVGYDARWGLVRASDAGAPHQRASVFILAYPHSTGLQGSTHWRSLQDGAEPDRRVADRDRDAANADGLGWNEGVIEPGDLGSKDREGSATIPDGHRADGSAADTDGRRHKQQQDARGVGSLEAGTEGQAREREWPRPVADAGSSEPPADTDSAGSEARRDTRPDGSWLRLKPLGHPAPAADAARREDSIDRNTDRWVGDGRGQKIAHLRPEFDQQAGNKSAGTSGLPGINWGLYGPAIRRWEQLTRPAPAPTIPGKAGRPRLNPEFVEWMMGLPAGHVTGHGLRPAQELKMLGNGVVPQQALLALHMLTRLEDQCA